MLNSLLSIALVSIFFYFLKVYFDFKNRYEYWKRRGVESLEPVFPLGNLWNIFFLKRGIYDSLYEWYRIGNGKVLGLYALDEPFLIIRDPELMKAILVKDFNSFTNRGAYFNPRQPSAGLLFKLPGEEWRPLRTKMTPCFTLNKIKQMFQHLIDVGAQFESNLIKETELGDTIDINDVCLRYAVDSISSSIFGVETHSFIEKDNEYYCTAFELFKSDSKIRMLFAALQVIGPRFFEIFSFLDIPTVRNNTAQFLTNVIGKVIEFRAKTGNSRRDMMQLLIQLKDNYALDGEDSGKEGKKLTMEELVAQAYTFFLVGSETTSGSLCFLFQELALNKNIQKRLQDEIDNCIGKSNGGITYDTLLDMKYLHMTISETLRKYPTPSFLMRQAVEDYRVPGMDLTIEKGTRVYISTFGLQRDGKYFPDPEKFDPDRFSSENFDGSAFTYIPYGEGPRNCIGKRLGHFMIAFGILSVLKNFNLDVSEKSPKLASINHLAYTTQPKETIYLKVTRRKK